MNKYLMGAVIISLAIILGITVAFWVNQLLRVQQINHLDIWGSMMPYSNENSGYSRGFYPNMMGSLNSNITMMNGNNLKISGKRILLDKVLEQVTTFIAPMDTNSNLKIAEIMEFENNFYAAIIEKDSGRAAFEILVDAYTGYVFPEYGPNMTWNNKYSHMGNGVLGENNISLEQAKLFAQKVLDVHIPTTEVEETGLGFYGYYTFDFKFNNLIAGMLSVNGFNGQVWLHTWHGQFINEKEIN
jgi:hypothetical protein